MKQQQLLQRLRTDGWCVIEDVIPAEQVDGVRQQVEQSVAEHRDPQAPAGIGHVSGFIRVDQSLAPYLAAPPMLALAEAMLGSHVRISFTSATINYSGNARGGWHADWPFNQNNAGHIPAPYPDAVMHLTTLWMLAPFTADNGGTLIVPGSHRSNNNPTGDNGVDPMAPYPSEMQAVGPAGSVLVLDSRLWHATAPNSTEQPRVSVVVRYAPWWLNTQVLLPGSADRLHMVDAVGAKENKVPPVPPEVFAALPEEAKPLFRHWVGERESK